MLCASPLLAFFTTQSAFRASAQNRSWNVSHSHHVTTMNWMTHCC